MLKLEEFMAPNRNGRGHVEAIVQDGFRRSLRGEGGKEIQSVGIVGAGIMGTAVAGVCLAAGLDVVISDVDEDVLNAAETAVIGGLVAGRTTLSANNSVPVFSPGMAGSQARRIVGERLRCSAEASAVSACDLILESVAENPRIKQEVYARLEPLAGEQTIIATNTSTIPIRELAKTLERPERFCGIHFFHPVRERPLLEIIHGAQTGRSAMAAASVFGAKIGKLPIAVEDGPGFLVNRLLLPYVTEAMELLLDGIDMQRIERVATEFGMAKGPLRLLDEIGLDTALQGGWVLSAAFPERTVSSPLLVAMIKAGNLGVKTGSGFFVHEPAGSLAEEPKSLEAASGVGELIDKWKRDSADATSASIDDAMILGRLLLPMVLEATRLLEEGAVASPDEIDLAVLFGLGFPIERGGLLYWADTIGIGSIVQALTSLKPLGERAQATKTLLKMAAEDRLFFC